MLMEDGRICESLKRIVAHLTTDAMLREDLMQECLLYLWRLDGRFPGRTRSWYLQNCRFQIRHWLVRGRSVDSLKRATGNNRIPIDEVNAELCADGYYTRGESFDLVCAHDTISTLASHLRPREQAVLGGLAEGLALRDIAAKLKLSYPTALKYRRHIAALTIKLGISIPLPHENGHAQCLQPAHCAQSHAASVQRHSVKCRRPLARQNAKRIGLSLALLLTILPHSPHAASPAKAAPCFSPSALVASPDGQRLYVACSTAGQVAVLDTNSRQIIRSIAVPDSPLGLALTSDGGTLYVTCAAPESTVCVVDTAKGKVVDKIAAGHTAMAPVLSPDGKTLFVCCRFNNCVDAIDLAQEKITRHFMVPREPVAAAITLDGKYLLVANHLHAGRADVDVVASSVSVINLASGKMCKEIALPNGSSLLRDVRISPDGRYAAVTHILARFHLPTTQVDRGWINSNAASLIDLAELRLINTVLLDNIDSGAANPWAAAWSADGKTLCVTHAGTHELSAIDFPALLAKLAKLPPTLDPNKPVDYSAASRTAADVPNDLSFLVGLRQRIKLSEADRGPRAVVLIGARAWLANYFTDTLSVIDLASARPNAECVSLSPLGGGEGRGDGAERVGLNPTPSQTFAGTPHPYISRQPPTDSAVLHKLALIRRGELLFNDATICFQGWQSCASCHSSDARVDGLNWDNLNDGIGNPKNAKSLLLAHQTPPSMWLGVRSNAYMAVRAGIRNSMFTVQPEECAVAIDKYLESLEPIPSPHLAKGRLSKAAARGKKLFFDEAVGCADCHKGKLYTDQKFHNVGTIGKFDSVTNRFDTPTLIEVWRSAPYLHDGRAASIRDVLTQFNADDKHGQTSKLSQEQIDDLAAFVLSL